MSGNDSDRLGLAEYGAMAALVFSTGVLPAHDQDTTEISAFANATTPAEVVNETIPTIPPGFVDMGPPPGSESATSVPPAPMPEVGEFWDAHKNFDAAEYLASPERNTLVQEFMDRLAMGMLGDEDVLNRSTITEADGDPNKFIWEYNLEDNSGYIVMELEPSGSDGVKALSMAYSLPEPESEDQLEIGGILYSDLAAGWVVHSHFSDPEREVFENRSSMDPDLGVQTVDLDAFLLERMSQVFSDRFGLENGELDYNTDIVQRLRDLKPTDIEA